MRELRHSDLLEIGDRAATILKTHRIAALASGLALLMLGVIAMVLPQIATLATELLVGWLCLIGGVLRLPCVLRPRAEPGYWGSLITALATLLFGISLLAWPRQGEQILTLLLTALFVFEGAVLLAIVIVIRSHVANWGWTALEGIVDFLLAAMVSLNWPSSATWAIGLLVGLNLLVAGLSMVMNGLAVHDSVIDKPSSMIQQRK